MTTGERLGQYAELMNRHGTKSREADQFLHDHAFDSEFAELAKLSRQLKESLEVRKSTAERIN